MNNEIWHCQFDVIFHEEKTMDYDDNFETLEELLNAINEAMQEKMETGNTVTTDPYNHYMFDNDDTAFEDLDSNMDAFGYADPGHVAYPVAVRETVKNAVI